MSEEAQTRAEEHKAKGNALFGQECFREAAEEYSAAIALAPENHVLFANRAACYVSKAVDRGEEALVDATRCVELAPWWAKGYARRAQAECLLKRYTDAEATCRAGMGQDNVDDKSASMLRMQLQVLRDAGHRTDFDGDKRMANVEAAQQEKARGNGAFQAKKWEEAANLFTKALELDPTDHIFWSNRSAAFAEQDQFENALRDAHYCVALKPDWSKGYSRLATPLYNLGRYPECLKAVENGLKVDPNNAALQSMVEGLKLDVAEDAEVQAGLHNMRADAKKQEKMMKMFSSIPGLDMSNVQMNGMGGFSGGGFGGLNMGMGMGMGGNKMSDAQMRTMARAMSNAGKGKFDQNLQAVSGDDGEQGADELESVFDESANPAV